MDIAGQQHWEHGYKVHGASTAFDPHRLDVRSHWQRRYHDFFVRAFSGAPTHERTLVEIGCGGSSILPYLSREFGFQVSGIDYSPAGCELARANLQAEGISADVICADVFELPKTMLEQFDVVVSFGVAEHFDDTASCIRAFARLLKPGGMMITTVPNMAGLVGLLQRSTNRHVYEMHTRLDATQLCSAHARAGLKVRECGYLLFANLSAVNLERDDNGGRWSNVRKVLATALRGITGAIWSIESMLGSLPPNRFTSPYAVCVASKLNSLP
jgi:2-polyprenyl-3-methyl-5-hydroxy-6-metoxy-1,4-benzoquinol methylase